MIELVLVGIGSGNPEHLTLQAIRTLEQADVILLPRKGVQKSDLADLRRMIARDFLKSGPKVVEFDLPTRDDRIPNYLNRVNDWHDGIAQVWSAELARELPQGGRAALMVWGDPSLYDSTLRIADRLIAAKIPVSVSVVPGITSLQMLTAAHAIPLNTLGAPVVITTGRQLRDTGWPKDAETVAVMLDGENSFQTLPQNDVQIWWGAYLGMPQQTLRHGLLADIATDIVDIRATARTQNGWIMDIYLLRKA